MPATTPKSSAAKPEALKVAVIPIDQIEVESGFNPRTLVDEVKLNELAASIADRGLLEPLGVSPLPDNKYKLNSGHRRHAACLRAKVTEVPIAIADRDDAERLIDAIATNMYREDLNPYDEAMAFKRLKDGGLSNKGIAEKLQVSEKLVADRLVIAELPDVLAERFRETWPTSLARTLKSMCALSGGEVLARVVADRIDASDGNVHRALEELRHDPVDYVGKLATQHGNAIAGVVPVSTRGGKAGGGYKGGPRWGSYEYNGFIDPEVLGKVDAALKDKINALKSVNSKDKWDRYNIYRIFLDQSALDALRAANVLFTNSSHKETGVCIALDALIAVCEPIIEGDYKGFIKAQAAEKRTVAKGPEAQAKADERAKAQAQTSSAREYNLMLGEQLAQHFSEVEPTLENVKAMCRMALLGASASMYGVDSGLGDLVKRGLRYVVPGWHQEVTAKGSGAISHRYPGEGTKNRSGEPTLADSDPVTLFWEWWNLAQTPAQVIGRTMQAITAAMYAKQEAIPQSRRVYSTPFERTSKGGPSDLAKAHLEQLVKPKLPKAGAPRPRPRAAAAPAKVSDALKTPAELTPAEKKTAAKKETKPVSAVAKADAALEAVGMGKQAIAGALKGLKGNDVVLAKRALAVVKTKPGATIPEMADHLKVPQNSLYRVLPKLAGNKAIHKAGRGWHFGEAKAEAKP